jgi:hypothetical protein
MIQIIIIVILLIIAAVSKSIMDTVNFHFETSIFSKFEKRRFWWNPSEGWKNKYKDRDFTKGRAFPGSLTWLVFVTDAWHFFQSLLYLSFFGIATLALTISLSISWYWYILIFIGMKILFSGVFELFWSKIWVKN